MNLTIIKAIEEMKKLEGYLGAAIFSPDGKMIGGVTDISGINFEIAGELFHNLLIISKNHAIESGFGNLDMMQFNTDKGIVFCKSFKGEKGGFNIILVIDRAANITMAKLHFDKAAESIKQLF